MTSPETPTSSGPIAFTPVGAAAVRYFRETTGAVLTAAEAESLRVLTKQDELYAAREGASYSQLQTIEDQVVTLQAEFPEGFEAANRLRREAIFPRARQA